MTLYFDSRVQFFDSDAVSTVGRWHPNEPIFAIASFSQDRGGSVTIFDDSGEPLNEVTYPVHQVSQATALAWHPDNRLLVAGWESGEIHCWFEGNREFSSVQGPHKVPIILMEFSEKGGRMVTADSMGLLTGWRCDGQYQFLTMFSHDLKDSLLHITFRRTVESPLRTELTNLAKAAVAGDEDALDILTNWRPRTAARNLTHSGVKDNHSFYVGTRAGIVLYFNQAGICTEALKNKSSPITQILWHPKRDAIVCLMEDMTVAHYLSESSGSLTELDRVKLSGKIPGNNGEISWAANSLAIITGDFTVRIWDIDTSDNFLLPMNLPSVEDTKPLSDSILPEGTNKNGIYSNSGILQYTTNTSVSHNTKTTNEVFTCIAYCPDNQTLCAGTNQGNLYTWKRTSSVATVVTSSNYSSDMPETTWQLNNISAVRGAIKQCYWGINEIMKPCILVNCVSNVYVLKEQPLLSCYRRNIWAVQRSANQVYVEHSIGKTTTVHADISITNLALTELNLILSNGKTIVVYRINKDDDLVLGTTAVIGPGGTITSTSTIENDKILSIKQMQTFQCECLDVHIHQQSSQIYCLTSRDIKIYSLGGVVLKEIQSNDNEGKVIGCDITSHYLTIFTMNGYIKLFDISRHEPKQMINPKSGYDLFESFGEFILAKCNSNGSQLALIIANESLMPDGKIYCWDFERDIIRSYDFLKDSNNNDNNNRLPINFYWDTDDNRLLAIEARSIHHQQSQSKKFNGALINKDESNKKLENYIKDTKISTMKTEERGENLNGTINNHIGAIGGTNEISGLITDTQTFVMFTTEKCFIKLLEIINLPPGEQLVNLCTPNVITLNISIINQITLRDFKGLENCDENTRKMVLDFSLNVALGNMDMAFRCIRSIQSEVVWKNLARMCVQTGRLDVAKVCLGHLKKSQSVRALRQAMEDDTLEKDAKTAVLAIELGMIDEAQTLYRKCGRFDLLNKLLQACGKIDEALQIAEQGDRVHLKNTYFKKAEILRDKGDIKGALEYYEKTQNKVQNVTHCLLDDPATLKKYMQNTKDPEMLKWWGQYIESTGDMDSAFKVYQKAEDWFSQVKILCFLGQLSKADSIARQSGDRAACYHLARHYENIGKYQEAIHFYTRAQTYSNAVRICKENDFQDELWTVANSARSRDKAIAAAYFEECGVYKKAVELYHRAGMLHKAVEMAFASKQPETLQVIASELTADSDPELVNRCAEFFISIEQAPKAVQLLAKSKQFERAIKICNDFGVPMTESLSELLTPNKDEIEESLRQHLLLQIGELLQIQGDYHTATKKFTQAGDKVRAMKSLLKSGDTEKIIFFAGMSRQREVYIMAANYLQALNWQNDPKILKNIVTFYSKGQAYDSLANFYATCAQVEIDEFRDYEKALKAMQEAAKCLSKVANTQRAADNLQNTIVEVKNVLSIQEALESGDNQSVIAGCRNMLVKPERPPIRQSDILAMLVQALAYSKLYVEAVGALRELALKDPAWSSRGLLDKQLVQKIAKECDMDFEAIWASGYRHLQTDEDQNPENLNDAEEIQEHIE
ncbi:intraflagellar transport protein 140 homolog [Condylostylus longicornis]|uniref:intraflagellar transport protein 140 homolog n=1 Tax=Condylostylus longicornis TaxID=2530218 RepID=UPI00244E48A4|nr:intraflagellar transport protein 140 homolog [Condylostylus longicornis]